MSNVTRIGLAAALVIASVSAALAQSYQSPQPARPSDGYVGRQLSSGERPNVGQDTPYYENASSTTNPGNANGGT